MGRGPLHFGHVYVYPPERAAARAALIFCAVVLVLLVFLDFSFGILDLLVFFFAESIVGVGTSSEALRFRFAFFEEVDTGSMSGRLSSARFWILAEEAVDGRPWRLAVLDNICCLAPAHLG